MRYYENKESGYVGILVLVLSVGILAFLYAKFYFLPGSNDNATEKGIVAEVNQAVGTTTAPVPDTRTGQMREDVNAARTVGNILNDRANEANDMLKDL
jgi:hypothetical protein